MIEGGSRLTFLLVLILFADFLSVTQAQSYEAYIYCLSDLGPEKLLEYFENRSGWDVTVYDLNDSSASKRLVQIVEMLTASGIAVIPSETCIQCLMKYLTWEDIVVGISSPLIGVFHNGELTAITTGVTDRETLEQALSINIEGVVKVFTSNGVDDVYGEGIRTQMEGFLLGSEDAAGTEVGVLSLVSPIVLLALADSVNPCTFAVFTALLLVALYSLNKRKVAVAGSSFVLAIFIGYCILGLGLFQVLVTISNIDKVFAAIGLAIGSYSIIRGLRPKFKSPVPKVFRKLIELQIDRSYASPVASFILGLTASFTLLPCSIGPYMVGLGLISTLKEPVQAYLLLTLYNGIFVSPLIMILVAVLVSSSLSRRVKAFRSKNLGIMEILSGALLTVICTYLLLF